MNTFQDKFRVDKWLWCVRIFKTRSIATQACEQGKILINDQPAKASRVVRENDIVSFRRQGLTRKYKVLALPKSRIGAKLLPDYMTELTDPAELEAYFARTKRVTIFRDPGTGRPTKRERRALDDFLDDI
ncbi:MAG: RNA-binding S4 domain-containing protein [Bacteroidetes bacterium]|nr:MAG: RNA-binding S4 domain-containing protein [Bacteroidota bacterium]REJ99954.1 MAG: RNA-binding S4 domain-containing protein [Bacteroidota bacterium]REK35866.1 MAG: RNA-binding S4 domain-containing protein [Bacteroidota bacterium]